MTTAPEAWGVAHSLLPAISEHNKVTGYMSFYKREPKLYRAGFALDAQPKQLPEGIAYTKFAGGKYGRFVMTGPYSNLGEASGRVWSKVSEKAVQLRDDFAIEHYVNDPRVTPEDQLVTEILVPAA
jgi:DNA gyrase inhibitor GyrI